MEVLAISAKTGAGLDELLSTLAAEVGKSFSSDEAVVVTRARHRQALEDCAGHIRKGQALWGGDAEIVAEELRLAARALGRLTGRVDVEDLLDVIFRDFCIGK